MVLWGQGEMQLRVATERLTDRFGSRPPPTSRRSAIARPNRSRWRSVATCRLRLPFPRDLRAPPRIVHNHDRRSLLQGASGSMLLPQLDVVLSAPWRRRRSPESRIGRHRCQGGMRLLAGGEAIAGRGVVNISEPDSSTHGAARPRAFLCSGPMSFKEFPPWAYHAPARQRSVPSLTWTSRRVPHKRHVFSRG